LAKFHRNILSLSENTAKSCRGYFLTHPVHHITLPYILAYKLSRI